MKKIFALLATLMLSITLAGCNTNRAEISESAQNADVASRFVIIEESGVWNVVADRETKVMYAVSRGTYNQGNFTMLVDSDGTPLLYEGEL